MKKLAIIGGGISGLTCAQRLKNDFNVTVFEKESKPGGLIRCERVNGSLSHICGGHVFNTKNEAVKHWFWSRFDKEKDWLLADRHSAVCMEDGRFVDYPIENHVYQLDVSIQRKVYADINEMMRNPPNEPKFFDEFLRGRFGQTLYDLYFKPYNTKVWHRDLHKIPLSWLNGKLPMPTLQEILDANQKNGGEVVCSFHFW